MRILKKGRNFFNNKIMKSTIITVILFLVIIAIYIELNIIVDKLKFPETDITSSKLYSISDETMRKINSIDKKVTIKLYNFDEYMSKTNIENSVALIQKYNDANKNIVIEMDNSTDYRNPTIVVCCDNNEKIVDIDYLYTYNLSTNTYMDIDYDLTEQELTNAIMEVSSQNKKSIYFCVTHSAYGTKIQEIYATAVSRLSTQLNDVYMINISNTEKIPDDCDVLIIPRVTEDFTMEEKNKIIDYINRGGNIIALQEAKSLIDSGETPNYQEILDLYGVSISDSIVMEGTPEYMLSGKPDFVIPQINKQSSIGKNMEENAKLFMIYAAKINMADEETLDNLNVSYEVVASTSDTSFLRNDIDNTSYEKIDTDEDAPNSTVAALITKKVDDDKTSKLLIFSNSVFISDYNISIKDKITSEVKTRATLSINDNEEIFEHAIKYLSENEDAILLRKPYSNSIPTVKLIENNGIVKLFFGLPLVVIFVGIIVWRHRKNKK